MSIAYLSLGSNLGDRASYLRKAIDLLKKQGHTICKISTIIETAPVGGVPQGSYLNLVLKIQTQFSLEDLFVSTSTIERQLGRQRKERNGPRIIDIDILLFDHEKLISYNLIVPHPRMFGRDFVMKPLKEIEPELCVSLEM
jgi:2-amino-4-hydroxy-6-hydroxymethyldihydropteridine diphosphokinase